MPHDARRRGGYSSSPVIFCLVLHFCSSASSPAFRLSHSLLTSNSDTVAMTAKEMPSNDLFLFLRVCLNHTTAPGCFLHSNAPSRQPDLISSSIVSPGAVSVNGHLWPSWQQRGFLYLVCHLVRRPTTVWWPLDVLPLPLDMDPLDPLRSSILYKAQ